MTNLSTWIAYWFRRMALHREDMTHHNPPIGLPPSSLEIPLSANSSITGTPYQIQILAQKLQQYALLRQVGEPVQVRLWNDETLVGTPMNLAALGTSLANTLNRLVLAPTNTAQPEEAVQRGIFHPPEAHTGSFLNRPAISSSYPSNPYIPLPQQRDTRTQPLSARATTGGLQLPQAGEANPLSPHSQHVSLGLHYYYAQICVADLQASWGWRPIFPSAPGYRMAAEHIIVAAVKIAVAYKVLLTHDQILALRWAKNKQFTCFLPAACLNAWSLLLQQHIHQIQARPYTPPTGTLNTGSLPGNYPNP